MTQLVRPDVSYADSWLAAFDEFGHVFSDGSGHHGPVEGEMTRERFEAMVADRLAAADPATPMPEGWVHCTFLWMVEGPEFIGNLAIRHSLTPYLLDQGGHIGYSVRPSRRREGHATRALAASLPWCRELGIDRVLVTCDLDNEASRRTIEANGGVQEDVRGGKRRYWIDL
jgi:predicted acetyltransferase